MRARKLMVMTLACLALVATTGLALAAERPNIVLVFSDDLAYQAISAYGEDRQLLQTPHMDSLAKSGMRFDRCLVTNSICGPSRAVVMTGKYSHRNGFYNNSNSRFDGSQQTFPKLLKAAGYSTAVIGKWHLMSDPVGFDYWQILPGQGIYYNPPMIDNGRKVKHQGYTTEIITDLSIDWLKNRDKSKPFLLMMQHKAPHREWSPALQDLGWDHDRDYPLPATFRDDYSGHTRSVGEATMTLLNDFTDRDMKLTPPPGITPEQLKVWNAYYEPRNEAFRKANLQGDDLLKWKYNRYMHDYLGCVKSVDDSVGKLLQTLEQEGVADNTLFVCTSDQGFYLAEHGWYDKRWIFEESLRTPMLITWPGKVKGGTVNKDIVSLLDLAQTFCEAAGLPHPEGTQGRSLIPVLTGETPSDWRKSFYYSYYEFPQPHNVRPHYGVVTDRYKLFHLHGDVDDWELIDLQADPHEVKNFYNDPAYADVQKKLHAELTRLREEVGDTTPPPRDAFGNAPFGNEPPRRRNQKN